MGSNREISNIAIVISKNYHFERVKKIISHFDGSNNIFADYTSTNSKLNFDGKQDVTSSTQMIHVL